MRSPKDPKFPHQRGAFAEDQSENDLTSNSKSKQTALSSKSKQTVLVKRQGAQNKQNIDSELDELLKQYHKPKRVV